MKKEHNNLNELVETLSPYISVSALARICGINESQMRQYILEIKNPSPNTLRKINTGLRKFGDDLTNMWIHT
jgi:hypothetical protein